MERDTEIIGDNLFEKYNLMNKFGSCQNCDGHCCEEQIITITNYELELIAKHLKMSKRNFTKKYLIPTPINDLILMNRIDMDMWTIKDKPCPFLKKGKCSIHKVRPNICRFFPISFSYDEGVAILSGLKICPISKNILNSLKEFTKNQYPNTYENFSNFYRAEGHIAEFPLGLISKFVDDIRCK